MPVLSTVPRVRDRSGGTTALECLRCDARVDLDWHDPRYGGLVRFFLDRHESCAGEIRITGFPTPRPL